MVLLKDFNIHVKNFTYLFLYFEVFSFFFFNQYGNVTDYIKWPILSQIAGCFSFLILYLAYRGCKLIFLYFS